MINFGITMQDVPNELPAEVALWLLERDNRYPDVEFKVDFWDVEDIEFDQQENLRQRFSRLIHLRGSGAPLTVSFKFQKQNWSIRIIGDLTASQRVEIAQMPTTGGYEDLTETTIGIPLKPDEVPGEGTEFVPVEPHYFTKGLVISGAEILDVTSGNPTERKSAIVKAMSEKDWDKAKELLRQRH